MNCRLCGEANPQMSKGTGKGKSSMTVNWGKSGQGWQGGKGKGWGKGKQWDPPAPGPAPPDREDQSPKGVVDGESATTQKQQTQQRQEEAMAKAILKVLGGMSLDGFGEHSRI